MYWVGHIATLVSIFAIFAALIIAYVVRSGNADQWHPIVLPGQLWLSTALLAACSGAVEMARRALRVYSIEGYSVWLVRTSWLAGLFLISQILCWRIMAAGIPAGDQNAGMFYILTGSHAVHILGGMTVLGYLLYRLARPWDSDVEVRREAITFMLATYWHFMLVIWLAIYAVFALRS
ncbi:MAG: cytochrome c oxidase subunit 3 [Acidobacteria bacterium]|nr:cytochrome c oxidase subunit 3 [Acidobacteriota bacterium]